LRIPRRMLVAGWFATAVMAVVTIVFFAL
jgi:hypothetical protein